MNRSTVISVIDAIAFAGFVLLISTGILLHYMLPPGSGRWSLVWGMSRHQWGIVHFWISAVFFAVLAMHLVLHWRFVATLFKGRAKTGSRLRVALGLVGLIAFVLLAVTPLLSPVQSTSATHGGQRHGNPLHRGAPIVNRDR